MFVVVRQEDRIEGKQSIITLESRQCCKAARYCCKQMCKWQIVTGNHKDDNWSVTYLCAALSDSLSMLQVSPATL